MTEASPQEGTIAILVVHGIGAQEPKETVGKVLSGLKRVEPDLAVDDAIAGQAVTIGGQSVRFYEVYWADLLRGARTLGAFQMTEFLGVSWFPWFNFRRHNYEPGDYSFVTVAWWTAVLPIVNFLIILVYQGANVLAQIGSRNKRKRETGERDTASSLRAIAKKAAGQTTKYTIVDGTLDEYVGDIFSYVNSAGGAFDEQSPRRGVSEQVIQRFYDQLLQAHADGCASIQIVAHSLGTVVSYHALAGVGFNADDPAATDAIGAARSKVSHLYTIGSPLEKVRFFWPGLKSNGSPFGQIKIQWDNFVSRFDPVAGVLRRFNEWGNVRNHRLLGGGFLRGHVVYEHSPVFLRAFMRGFCGHECTVRRTSRERLKDWAVLIGETLLTPVLMAFVLALGVAVFALTVTILPYLLALPFRPFVDPLILGSVKDTASLVTAVLIVISLIVGPSVRASRVHRRYWAANRQDQQQSTGDE